MITNQIYRISGRRVAAWSLLVFLLLAAPTWTMSWFVYQTELSDEQDQLHQVTAAKARALKGLLRTELENVIEDVHLLAGSVELIQLIEQADGHNRQHLVNAWLHFTKERHFYDQIRYIDEQGHEIVRINTGGGRVWEVPPEELQNKHHRYYVKEGLQLARNEIYVSPFDLNKERGAIETPHKPMIRFVGAVFDRAGKRRGLVVLNYLGARLLNQLDSPDYASHGRFLLVNNDGYYLRGMRREDEWGFMFPESGLERSLRRDFPALWAHMSLADNGWHADEKGWFLFQRISLPKGANQHLRQFQREWTLINFVSGEALRNAFQPLREAAIKLNFLAAPVLLLAAVLLSYLGEQRRQTFEILRLSATAFDTQEAIVIADEKGELLRANRAFSQITGHDEPDDLPPNVDLLVAGEQDETLFEMERKLAQEDHWNGQLWIRHRDGTTHPTRQMISAVRGIQGEIRYYVYRFFDVTEELSAKKELERLATTDALTGIRNRRHFEEQYHRELKRSRRFGRPLSVILADIDRFKRVNDRHGHARGDEVLRGIAEVMRTRVRGTDLLARWGGEEFIILLPETDLPGARRLAETLRQAVEDGQHGGVSVTISAGVAEHEPTESDRAFFERLDAALYRAKGKGRNTVIAAESLRLAALK